VVPNVATGSASTSTPVRCLSAPTCVRVSNSASAAHLWMAANLLSLPGAGTVYSDILGLIVLNVNMIRRVTVSASDLTRYRVS